MTSNKHIGNQYEALAQRYLQRQGLSLLDKNFHAHRGEIDLIMIEASVIVFIEVKYRNSNQFGSSSEMLKYAQAKRIQKTGIYWLIKNNYSPENTEFRFDLIAISQEGKSIEWFKNVITQG